MSSPAVTPVPAAPVAPTAVPPEPDHLPHDIREIIPYVWNWGDWRMWALLGAALVLLGFLAYWLWKRKKSRPLPPPEDPLLVAGRFLQQLLPPEPFVGKVQAEYFYQLNLGLRRYLELSCGFSATEMTLRELRFRVQHLPHFSVERKQELMQFFERSDIIKFAKAETSLPEAQACHGQILGWLKWWNQILETPAERGN